MELLGVIFAYYWIMMEHGWFPRKGYPGFLLPLFQPNWTIEDSFVRDDFGRYWVCLENI